MGTMSPKSGYAVRLKRVWEGKVGIYLAIQNWAPQIAEAVSSKVFIPKGGLLPGRY